MKSWSMEDKDGQVDTLYGHTDGEWGSKPKSSKPKRRQKQITITAYKLFDEKD